MGEKTVFISYSHDSDDHRERVLALSERLREDGIETLLDQYVNGSPQQGWPRWMLDQLDAADSVLVVCTETYYRRFRGFEEPGKGKGVDWEGALITQEIYDRRSRTLKFVPVFLSAVDESWIPEPLRSGAYYALTSESSYQRLYDFLLEQAGVEPQPVGALKTKPRRKGTPLTFPEPPPSEVASELISPQEFDDHKVREATIALDQLRAEESLTMRTLVGTLDRLFERDTFRWEPSVGLCPTQEWDHRLHSAIQTLWLFQEYDLFVETEARHSLQRYRELTAEVSQYCQRMAAYLFQPPVGLAELRRFVGTLEFINKVHQKKKWFEGGVDPQTCRKIDPHLENAIRRMKTLHDEFCGTAESSGSMPVSQHQIAVEEQVSLRPSPSPAPFAPQTSSSQKPGQDIMPSHQFNARRLKELEELLDIEYEKSHEFEKEISMSDGASRITLKQRFKRDVAPRLRALEQEYAEMLVAGVPTAQIPEADADAIVSELSEATGMILQTAPANAPQEMLRLLGEIKNNLSEPKGAASAKLKVSLPLIPTICSYEMEVETAGLMKKVWRKGRDFFKGLVSDRPK